MGPSTAAVAFLLLAASASAEVSSNDDSLCHLQTKTAVSSDDGSNDDGKVSSNDDVANKVDSASDSAKLERDAKCPLPPNAQWCTVRMGLKHDTFSMAVYSSADIVSNSICSTGTWELQLHDVTDLGEPGHALDIGANVGFYSLVLAAAGWNVTSFEPMHTNIELIEASMCANPDLAQKITLNKFGLGAKDDHCNIISGDDNLGDGVSVCGDAAKKPVQAGYHKRATIDIRRLDDVLAQEQVDHINFVKMDVEGFECQVMAGGQSLLSKYRPRTIQSEVWPDMQGCLPQDYLASFAKASYSVARDRACSTPDLSRPSSIDNRYMCRKTEQKAGLSLLESVVSLGHRQRAIVWLTPDE